MAGAGGVVECSWGVSVMYTWAVQAACGISDLSTIRA